jgi:hypothetical protein
MTDPVAETTGYYNRHAAGFAAQTANIDMESIYRRFHPHVRTGERTLDAGCGVGRDAVAFADRGYDVVAIDASERWYGWRAIAWVTVRRSISCPSTTFSGETSSMASGPALRYCTCRQRPLRTSRCVLSGRCRREALGICRSNSAVASAPPVADCLLTMMRRGCGRAWRRRRLTSSRHGYQRMCDPNVRMSDG